MLDPRINPTYDEWTAVMEWMPYVGSDTMAGLATKYFFTRVGVFSSENIKNAPLFSVVRRIVHLAGLAWSELRRSECLVSGMDAETAGITQGSSDNCW